MKISHLVTAILVSLVVILSGNLIFGIYNTDGYEVLAAHRDRLAANVQELEERHRQLEARVELLRRSSDAVEMEARDLQYYAPDEIVIRLEDANPRKSQQSPGRIILGGPVASWNRALLRIAALVVGGIVLLFLVISDRRRHAPT